MNKEEIKKLFILNNALISAYGTNSFVGKVAIKDNELYKMSVPENLLQEYNSILNGNKITIKKNTKATLESANMLLTKQLYSFAFVEYAELLKQNPDDINYLKNICVILMYLGAYDTIKKFFFNKLLKYVDKDDIIAQMVAKIYTNYSKKTRSDFIKAFNILDKLIKNGFCESNTFFEYAWINERLFQDKTLDLQIKYTEKAAALGKDEDITSIKLFLASLYHRNNEPQKSYQIYQELLKTSQKNNVIYSYTQFLISTGNLTEGYNLYKFRTQAGTVYYPIALLEEKRWDGIKDISNSTIIIHFEQGFGDSIMFSRYVQDIAKMAKKTIFVVQKNLIPLFKTSGFEEYCTLMSHHADLDPEADFELSKSGSMYVYGSGMLKVEHDYHIPIMDAVYILKECPGKIRHSEGFLKTDPSKVEKYRKKYINKNKKLKIGISYHGAKATIWAYRDVPLKYFLPLFKMENVEIYGLQADEHGKKLYKYMDKYPVYDLGKTFNSFEDTACAIECMDVIISTDNVIMNLAGALGKKTYGLFNVYPEFRWYKTEGEDLDWYKTVKPFRAKTFSDWKNVIKEVQKQLIKDFDL